MNTLVSILTLVARHARWVLVMGLALGLLFQDVAYLARPAIPVFIALQLFLASFRVGLDGVKGAFGELTTHLWITFVFQLAIPLLLIGILLVTGATGVFVTALLLVAAAAPISGSPNLVIMLGHNPAPALRQLVIGTAALPLTIIPILLFLPGMGDVAGVALAALKLLAVILLAAVCGFSMRRFAPFRELSQSGVNVVDGLSAIVMALVVVGLMSAIGQAWLESPWIIVGTMAFAFAVNFGLQIVGSCFWGRIFGQAYDVPMSVISGNRNVALYLTALPATVTDNLLVFIGCYQFPMYLTPLLLRSFYARKG